ncbi:ligand-binding sensor domain-containing protein [Pontibacter kalidii]|uniref:hypothetical protein n=1 Tax=Pontibacter kalidii TaxID=2592049 RepID=UPI002258AEF8|nr:hypothetical protein [Pontibacter kalidii]
MMRKLTYAALLWLGIACLSPGWAQTASGKYKNLGPQVYASLIQGSVFADDAAGKSYAYTVVRGRPAHFVGYSLDPLKLVVDAALPETDGSWDVEVSTDGIVYIAAANGVLFQHVPGTDAVTSLGIVLPGEKVIWDLAAGKDGEIFGGTYPGCRVFRYHPKDGFSDVGRGPLVEDENYVRSVTYHRETGKIYAGIASHSAMVELDPKTGEKKQLLPDQDRDQEAIYHINLVHGLKGGDRVFGWLTGPTERVTTIYNLKTRKFEAYMPTMDVKSIIKAPKGSKVYYTAGKKLYEIDYAAKVPEPKELASTEGETKTVRWGKNGMLYLLTGSKHIHTFNPKTGHLTTEKVDIPGQPIDIQSIGIGPDGLVWSGGYLAGGHATYNPKTGENRQLPGLDQTEGLANLGTEIYFGIYAKARLYAYDTQKPWDLKQNNPRLLGQIKGQDRPFAVLGLEKLNKVLFGTVPGYGQLGGALVAYDVAADKLETITNLIPDQSIVSLVEAGDLVIGGTSIFGGLGGKPTQAEAKVFGWDPVRKQKTFELVPVPGAMAITGLMKGPDGHIWGFADGDLFVLDVAKCSVISTHRLFEIHTRPSHIWRSAFMMTHPSGVVYASVNGRFLKIDPHTMQMTQLEENVGMPVMDEQGKLYFKRGMDLWLYEPEATVE